MRENDCPECQKFWREYAEATTNHIRLQSKLRLAELERKQATVVRLTPELETAGERRAFLREAIRQHESAAHGTAAETAESGDV